DTRTTEIQAIRNSIRGDAVRTSGRSVRTDTEMIGRRALKSLIIVMRNADKPSEIGSFFEIEHESGVFDCFPCSFEQQSMLRIYVGGLTRRNPNNLRIKLRDSFH